MDKSWNKIITEEVPKSHRDAVLAKAHDHFASRKISRYWKWGLSFAISLGVAAVLWVTSHPLEYEYYTGSHEVAFLELEPHEVDDIDVVSDLELLEDWEVLDQWSSN